MEERKFLTVMTKDRLSIFSQKGMEWCVYLTLFSLPFSKSIIEICVSIGLALFFLKRSILKDFKLPRSCGGPALLFVFVTALISLVNTRYFDLSLRALFTKNLKFIFLYFLVIEAIDTREKMLNLLKMGLISVFVISCDTLIQYFATGIDIIHNYPSFKYVYNPIYGYASSGKRVIIGLELFRGYPTGSFPYPNDLSAWLLIVMPVGLFLSILDLRGKRWRPVIFLIFTMAFYIFILAKARSAWLSFILAAGPAVFLAGKVIIVLFIIMFALIALFFYNSLQDIFGITSALDRGVMWDNGFKIFLKHPVIGNGINTFFSEYKEIRQDECRGERGSYAHNCYLQMAADTGILGLSAFLWFVGIVFVMAVRAVRKIRDRFWNALILGLTIGVGGFLIHSFFDTNLYSLNLASLFWLSAGALVSGIRIADIHSK